MASNFEAEEILTFRLTHECNEEDCPNKFSIAFSGTKDEAKAAEDMPIPNARGWADGYCPHHVPPDGS